MITECPARSLGSERSRKSIANWLYGENLACHCRVAVGAAVKVVGVTGEGAL